MRLKNGMMGLYFPPHRQVQMLNISCVRLESSGRTKKAKRTGLSRTSTVILDMLSANEHNAVTQCRGTSNAHSSPRQRPLLGSDITVACHLVMLGQQIAARQNAGPRQLWIAPQSSAQREGWI